MLSEETLKGSINSADRQLLWDIRELLKEQNALLRQMCSTAEGASAKEEVNPEQKQRGNKNVKKS